MSEEHDGTKLDFGFISTLCHELRSPLFPIIALSDLILKQPELASDEETLQSHIRMMHRSGHELLALIQDLHRLSRLEAHRVVPKISNVELPTTFANIQSKLINTNVGQSFSGELNFDDASANKRVLIDHDILDHVIRDLLEGISTHVPEELPKSLQINASATEVRLSFRVPKLKAEDSENALHAFWRPPWKISPAGKTNGMKFFLAHQYCKSVGGQGSLREIDGQTAFEFHIPARTLDSQSPQRRGQDGILITENFAAGYLSILRAAELGYSLTLKTPSMAESQSALADTSIFVDQALEGDIAGHSQPLPLTDEALSLLDD